MNNRVALLLAGVLALAGGAFAISWDHARSPRAVGTVGQSVPMASEKPAAAAAPTKDQAPAVTTEAPKPEKPAAAETPAKPMAPVVAAPPAKSDKSDKSDKSTENKAPVAAKPIQKPADQTAAKAADKQSAPLVTAPPKATEPPATAKAPEPKPTPVVTQPPPAAETPATAKAPEKQPAPVVATAPPASEKPAAAKKPSAPAAAPVVATPAPADKKPAAAPAEPKSTPVVTAPPAQTEKPATAAAPAPEQKPVMAAPAPERKPTVAALTPEAKPAPAPKPTIVMTPLPEKRPEISRALLERTSPAKFLFAAEKLPSKGRSRAIGYYPRGCLAGGVELPVNGPTWQVMRLSRNRNWGHPELVRFLERFAPAAAKATGWPGILVGDMSQPRGGPLPWGHRSHQIGLDVDIWFRPMPDHRLSRKQRETMSATHLVKRDGLHLNPKTWTLADAAFIHTAAEQPEVERVLVNARIKQELCKLKGKKHWPWMAKVRPWYGHDDHIHVRLKCPKDSPHCRHQPPVPGGAGCSKQALAYWFSDRVLHPKPAKHPKPRKQIMLTDLPHACKVVLNAPAKKSRLASDGN